MIRFIHLIFSLLDPITYENRFKTRENLDTTDNEFLYTWYKSQYDSYEDEVLFEVPIELIHELS